MLKATIIAVAAIVLSTAALADEPGADWMSKNDVVTKMQGQGYSAVVIEADDGHWEGEAIKDGKIVEFHADAHTGAITKSKPKTED
jgi:hypothetical protein